jgi:hypothetical protein
MTSPFERRASEQIVNVGTFLAHVAPAPLEMFFQEKGENDTLYDRLAVITGSPGSGKTTIARLFEFETLFHLSDKGDQTSLNDIYRQMEDCRALDADFPLIAGTRLSMETNYRDLWECPYEPRVKHWLIQALISARAILGWVREFTNARIPLTDVRPVFHDAALAGAEAVGEGSLESMRERAAAVERAVYRIATALIAPSLDAVSVIFEQGYEPLDVLSGFVVRYQGRDHLLRPLVMLDDVHALHIDQRKAVIRWLARREMSLARWVLWRFDALDPEHVLYDGAILADVHSPDPDPGLQVSREITEIRLQNGRNSARRVFRRMAKQISRLYLNQMSVFKAERVETLEEMLENRLLDVPQTLLNNIEARTRAISKVARLPAAAQAQIEKDVEDYIARRGLLPGEAKAVKLGMIAILVARTAKRTPQVSLFDDASGVDESSSLVAEPKTAIEHGARLQLANLFDLPYYYGAETLYDAGSENAEQFLRMAAPMIKLLQVKTIRKRAWILSAREQDETLRKEASRIIQGWNFPEYHAVRRLAERIADMCYERTMEDNASLGGGASGVGIPMEEFLTIGREHPSLARVLQFGMAYNVFSLQPDRSAKNRSWCVIELGGAILIQSKLTFQKGGFVERRLKDLLENTKEIEE